MAAEHRSEDAIEASEQSLEQDAPEEAPAGASSGGLSPDEEEAQLTGEEQRQRAGAAAAYAAAQNSAPLRPAAESEGDEPEPDAGATDAGAPAAEAEAVQQPEDGAAGAQVEQDLDELAARAERADEYLQLAQRTQADFENYRKRAAREAALAQDRGVAKLAKELLPAIDNLDRALKAASDEESQIAEGIKLVHTDLLSALQRVGVEPFSPDGEQFDPQYHEAVAQQPIDGVESGMVAEVFQQGYRLGDSVLRPARVLVAA